MSRARLFMALTAVVVAVLGLATLVWATLAAVRPARVEPYLAVATEANALVLTVPAVLFGCALLVLAALVPTGRPAARSALVWVASTGTALVLWLCLVHYTAVHPTGYDVWLVRPWIGAVATPVTLLALVATAVCARLPVTRRAPAAPVGDTTATVAPAPLRRAVGWIVAGSVAGIGAFALAVALDSTVTVDPLYVMMYVVIGGAPLLAGAVWASVTAGLARSGRLMFAHLARAGAAILLAGLWFALVQDAEAAVIAVGRYADARPIPLAVGVGLLLAGAAAIAATVTGLAGLADPRTERYVRDTEARENNPWAAWEHRPAPSPLTVVVAEESTWTS
ncbi:hypothetical protein KZZ52_25210 [Dactylosporangium sp. AC04546]|uniref:hypothetical protein n=1 Tax=Dactylosporangium sp. AC04546 TaxID=2862460 RepID=UPI001EDF5386|nr:hypothetical protein [Dactylosporangium sp. AC04546]WVK88570.1 hypothetical protein KZZ52_25210 [Dactylosporangium sp. AC04546]